MKRLYILSVPSLCMMAASITLADFQDVKGKVLTYGPVRAPEKAIRIHDPASPTGKKSDNISVAITELTNTIPAKHGAVFGIEITLTGFPANEIVNLRRVTSFPAMQLPSGKLSSSHTSEFKTQILPDGSGYNYVGWEFTEPFELVTGNWRFEVWYQDTKLLEKWFRVIPDPTKKNAAKKDNAKPTTVLSDQKMAQIWKELTAVEYEIADNAWRKFFEAGDGAIPYLRQQICQPIAQKVELELIEKHIANLDSGDFATREKAVAGLVAKGDLAIVALQRVLERNSSVEAKERAKLVLTKLGEPILTLHQQRALIALDLLEQSGTSAAMSLLEKIERDALVPQIRLEARRALNRSKLAQKAKK